MGGSPKYNAVQSTRCDSMGVSANLNSPGVPPADESFQEVGSFAGLAVETRSIAKPAAGATTGQGNADL